LAAGACEQNRASRLGNQTGLPQASHRRSASDDERVAELSVFAYRSSLCGLSSASITGYAAHIAATRLALTSRWGLLCDSRHPVRPRGHPGSSSAKLPVWNAGRATNRSFSFLFTVRSGTTRATPRTMAEFISARSGIDDPKCSSRWTAGPSQ